MSETFIRTRMLYGEEAMKKLAHSRVAVFGAGGVGGHVIEALARSGIGALDIIDNDTVSESNLNRQILATRDTIGLKKTQAAKDRIASINPDCKVTAYDLFYLPETADEIDFSQYDYIADAIDTVAGKIQIIENAVKAGVPVISSMGAGNRIDPSSFRVVDISKTENDPLARVMRTECRKRGINHFKVVWSSETALKPLEQPEHSQNPGSNRRSTPGSNAFTPGTAGLIMAGEIINDLTK